MSDNLLDRAASRLRGHHGKGKMKDRYGNVCMDGAFVVASLGETMESATNAVDGLPPFAHPAYTALEETVFERTGLTRVFLFNDRPSTSEADALEMFALASKRFESETVGALR